MPLCAGFHFDRPQAEGYIYIYIQGTVDGNLFFFFFIPGQDSGEKVESGWIYIYERGRKRTSEDDGIGRSAMDAKTRKGGGGGGGNLPLTEGNLVHQISRFSVEGMVGRAVTKP